jgi:phosphate transport system protein
MSADHALDLSPSSLKQGLIELADMVKHSMNASARALAAGDSRIAHDVNTDDVFINRFRFELEEHCYRVLRSQSLTERELRHVVGALKVATCLERVGDYAADIAYQMRQYLRWPALKEPLVPILQMAEVAEEMVMRSVDAYLDTNDYLAETVVRRDRELDDLNEQAVFSAITAYQRDHDEGAVRFVSAITRDYMRMGERSANICERAIYIATGELKEFRR